MYEVGELLKATDFPVEHFCAAPAAQPWVTRASAGAVARRATAVADGPPSMHPGTLVRIYRSSALYIAQPTLASGVVTIGSLNGATITVRLRARW